MKTTTMRLITIIALSCGVLTQSSFAQSDARGFFLGFHLGAAAWTLNEYDVDAEGGGGAGLMLGYGVTQSVTLFANIDGASIQPETGSGYGLAHFDLGAQLHFGSRRQALRPYLEAALAGIAAQFDVLITTVEVSGAGVTMGGGLKYFLSRAFCLDLGLVYTTSNLSNVTVGGLSVEIDEGASSMRANLGIIWYPNK